MDSRILYMSAAILMTSAPSFAHHSFQAEYDVNKPMTLTGTVTKFEWTNPHARFYVDVKDESGKVVNWNFELASPNVLRRLGWTREMMKPGDMVTVKGHQAKDGASWGNANSVALADGRVMNVGSSADESAATRWKIKVKNGGHMRLSRATALVAIFRSFGRRGPRAEAAD